MSAKRIVVLFGFDMESDIGSWTTGYEGLKYGSPKILKILKKYVILLWRCVINLRDCI